MWAKAERAGEEVPLDYPRGGVIPKEFVELEIDYDPALEAYLWLAFRARLAGGNCEYVQTLYHAREALSSRFVSIDRQLADMLDYDARLLKEARLGFPEDADDEPWVYSPFFRQEVPRYLCSDPGCFEHSDLLLDYVPPDRIRERVA
jgi:hypothetical protein